MRIFATKQIECGGSVRSFTVNLYATAQFCEFKGIKLSEIGTRLTDISLLDLMDFAYFACLSGGNDVERAEFMKWFDDSELFTEFSELLESAFSAEESEMGKSKKKQSR